MVAARKSLSSGGPGGVTTRCAKPMGQEADPRSALENDFDQMRPL